MRMRMMRLGVQATGNQTGTTDDQDTAKHIDNGVRRCWRLPFGILDRGTRSRYRNIVGVPAA